MDLLLKYLNGLVNVISWLNLRKVLLLALASLATLICYTAYEERTRILTALSADLSPRHEMQKFNISDDIAIEIRYMTRLPIVSMVAVYAADLQINERMIAYRYADDPYLTDLWDKQIATAGNSLPLFTHNTKVNALVVSIINGQFSCHPYQDTMNREILRNDRTPVLCFVSLPPYYGSFSGYVEVSLARVPTTLEQQTIEIEIKRLSNDIFFKNVMPTRRQN